MSSPFRSSLTGYLKLWLLLVLLVSLLTLPQEARADDVAILNFNDSNLVVDDSDLIDNLVVEGQSLADIPEPALIVLFGLGLSMLAARLRSWRRYRHPR